MAARVEAAGYGPDDPLVVGVQPPTGPPAFLAHGRDAAGEPLGPGSVVYVASLAKQVVAACVALLVRQGRLELTASVTDRVPELPAWARPVRVEHLLVHTGGLPEVCAWEDLQRAGLDRTTDGVLRALGERDGPDARPGAEHRYSNAGYVCLGLVVARAAGRPFAEVAHELVLGPLGLDGSRFWSGPDPAPPGSARLRPEHPAPLSLGDGGLWSSAVDLLRWGSAMHRDVLGVADLVQAPGHLDDGTALDYAGGVGVRDRAGRRLYRHGGRWGGLCAHLLRLADDGSGFVLLALDDDDARADALAEGLLDELVP